MKKDKFVLVKGCAGIGNRMFTLAAAVRYAKKTGRKLIVDWGDGVFAEKGKDAFQLFFKLVDIEAGDIKTVEGLKNNLTFYPSSMSDNLNKDLYEMYCAFSSKNFSKLKGAGRLRGRLSRVVDCWHYLPGNNFGKAEQSDLRSVMAVFSPRFLEKGHKLSSTLKQDVVLFADYWPGQVDSSLFKHIVFNDEFYNRLAVVKSELGLDDKTVGVHIRSTDKQPGKGFDKLLGVLSAKIKQGQNIFLATDNVEIETSLKSLYGEKVSTLKKFYPENNSDKNMHHWSLRNSDYTFAEKIYEECLLDLMLLAGCSQFYYQGNSSYSMLALIYGKGIKEKTDWLKL